MIIKEDKNKQINIGISLDLFFYVVMWGEQYKKSLNGWRGQKVQTFSYKINKSQGYDVQYREYNYNLITIITCMVTDCYYLSSGGNFMSYVNVQSLCCTSEINIICQLYFNF